MMMMSLSFINSKYGKVATEILP